MSRSKTSKALRCATILTYATTLAISSPGLAKNPPGPPPDPGPAPSWADFKELAEATVRGMMKDPDSAQFAWAYGYARGEYRFGGWTPKYGYKACGSVNAKNAYGGYVGARAFVVVEENGRATAEVAADPKDDAEYWCAQDIARNLYPAISELAVEQVPSVAQADFGLTLKEVPDGALIVGVEPGGPADTAGLKKGMTITSINGVPIDETHLSDIERAFARSYKFVTVATAEHEFDIRRRPTS